jgi:Flp pilus assembly protein TadG
MMQLHAPDTRGRGQVLVLFALFLVVLLGAAALVVDVARVYSLQRFERSVADAAALAGAQDLQDSADSMSQTTIVTYPKARADALTLLNRELGGTSAPTCATPPFTSNLVDCPILGTDYLVSVKVPSPSVMTVDAAHAVQVTVRQKAVSMTFARLFGQSSWNVGITSVAGLASAPHYAVAMLQPPHPKKNLSDANLCQDLKVDGNNTVLNVSKGDIGTNTSAATTNAGLITMASGYFIDHYDDITNASCGLNLNPTWTVDANGDPQGQEIKKGLIPDPQYMYPSFVGAPLPFTSQSLGVVACSGSGFPTGDLLRLPAGTTCYTPGIYSLGPTGKQPFNVGSGETVYLMPGAYYFRSGLTVSNGSLYGGLISRTPSGDPGGVVLEVPETAQLDATTAANFVLNMGGSTCNVADETCKASPALDFSGAQVKTTPGDFVLSIEVDRNEACFSDAIPLDVGSCGVGSSDTAVKLAGSGSLEVAGVIYGPSDQMTIKGNSSQVAVGEIYGWTITYTGGSTLTQAYPGSLGNGVLRLDSACSGLGTTCNP